MKSRTVPWLVVLASLVARPTSALHGQFLTLSDLHFDRHYVAGSQISKACHDATSLSSSSSGRKQPEPDHKSDRAGFWGTPNSDCDSPATLIDATLRDVEQKCGGKVDFVIAMGDFARHDLECVRCVLRAARRTCGLTIEDLSSSDLPRTMDEILDLNQNLTTRLSEIFPDVPLVPSIGNNDVWPHNIMRAGPTHMISSIESLWQEYIPEEQFHTFARGGYYAKEVIPGELVVVSLNTLLWFSNNKVVDGCPAPSKSRKIDPGSEQLRWLNAQLEQWRDLGMQVILSGHVPPTDYYDGCYDKFAEIALAYQDTIVATMFGHKNVDTFNYFSHSKLFSQEEDKVEIEDEDDDENLNEPVSSLALPDDLHSAYTSLPRRPNPDDYLFWNIAPSVIPTYLPAYRVWRYNTTSESKFKPSGNLGRSSLAWSENVDDIVYDNATLAHYDELSALTQQPFALDLEASKRKKSKKHGKKKNKKKKKKTPSLPRHVSAESPSRTNRYLTPLGYVQYYLDLDKWNTIQIQSESKREEEKWPVFDVEYATGASAGSAVESYGLSDLTVTSWLRLARQVTRSKKAWSEYEKRMYVNSQS